MSTVDAVGRTVSLIERLVEHPTGLGVLKLAQYTKLAPSTVHRYLSALQAHGIVEQGGDRQYRLTSRLYLLGLPAAGGFALEEQARGSLERLAERSHETACLMVRDGRHAVCVAQIDSRHPLQIAARVGNRQDLRVGATSRLLLAFAPPDVQEEILALEPVSRFTDRTVIDPEAIRDLLVRIRRDGYYVSRGELDQGVVAVSAPIRNRKGEVIAAIVIAAPESRASEEALDDLTELVVTEARGLSLKLGFSSPAHPNEETSKERSMA